MVIRSIALFGLFSFAIIISSQFVIEALHSMDSRQHSSKLYVRIFCNHLLHSVLVSLISVYRVERKAI